MRQQTFFITGWLNILFQVVFPFLLYAGETFSTLNVEGARRTAVTSFPVLLRCAAWAWFFYLTKPPTSQVATRLKLLLIGSPDIPAEEP